MTGSRREAGERAARAFREAFGHAPDVIAYAPGRVNLIGEHTDYNDGFVLPCAIPYGTAVALSRQQAARIDAVAADLGPATSSFALPAIRSFEASEEWSNHLRGVYAGLAAAGLAPGGARIAIAGDVPQGAGLSSSAALGVATGLGLAALAGDADTDRLTLARIAQQSEHRFVGCECGIMDQLASAMGVEGAALLIDCRSLEAIPVPLPGEAAIMIVHSGIERELATSAYNERRAQCAAAARHYGVASLRELDPERLASGSAGLDPTLLRRARHVVSENARVISAANAFERGDLSMIGRWLAASHASLRDDFEVTVPAVDALVDCMAEAIGEEGGVRMTGGGFGGCVVAVTGHDQIPALEARLAAHWRERGFGSPLQTVVRPVAGAELL